MSSVEKLLALKEIHFGAPVFHPGFELPGQIRPVESSSEDVAADVDANVDAAVELAIINMAGKITGIAGVTENAPPFLTVGFEGKDPSPEKVAEMIQDLSTLDLEIIDGALTVVRNGTRFKIRRLGDEVPFEPLSETPDQDSKSFPVPNEVHREKKVTAFSVDDSHEKETIWRRGHLIRTAQSTFPKGWKAIPKQDRNLVCFPGEGKEAELWMDFGVDPDKEMIFIENNQGVIDRSCTHGTPFYRKRLRRNRFIKKTFQDVPNTKGAIESYIARKLPPDGRVSILSIDPNNALFQKVFDRIVEILAYVPLADECLVFINFNGGRRQDMTLYHEIYQEMKGQKFKGDNIDLKREAMKFAIPYACRLAKKTNPDAPQPFATSEGFYEGNHAGGGSLRLFASAQLKRS
jgi:hypothetical protein